MDSVPVVFGLAEGGGGALQLGEGWAERRKREFAAIWQRHVADLYRYCLFWTGGREEDAEEALSRAAAVAFQKLPEAAGDEGPPRERRWLLTVTRNACMDLHRERRRKREQSLEDFLDLGGSEPGLPAGSLDSPEEHFLQTELQAYLLRCIRELPPRLRGPMSLHALQEMPYREIASALSITEVNVRKRLQEARQLLRHRLQAYRAGAGYVAAEDLAGGGGDALVLPPPPVVEIGRCRAMRPVRIARPDGREADLRIELEEAPPQVRSGQRLAALAEYVRRHPGGWKKRLELARLLTARGDGEGALPHYRFVVELRPGQLAARLELGRLLRAAGREAEAVALWREGLEVSSRPAARHHLTALIEEKSRPAVAEEELRAAIALEPECPAHRTVLGALLAERHRPVEAVEVLDGALAIDPDNGAALLLSLDPLLASSRPREAGRRALRALEVDPGNPLALARVIELRATAGKLQGAEGSETGRLMRCLGRLAGEQAETHAAQARLHLATGRWDLAEQASTAWVKAHPRHARGWLLHGHLLVRIGKGAAAAYAFAEAHALEPSRVEGVCDLAAALAALGRLLDARRLLDQGLEAHPEAWTLLAAAASFLPRAGEGARRAADLARRVVELQPLLAGAWFARARVLAQQGQRSQALGLIRHGWDLLPPDDALAQAARAALLAAECHGAGQAEQRHEWLQRALEAAGRLSADDPAAASFLRGQALALLGDRAQAVRSYRAALAQGLPYPQRAAVELALQLLGASVAKNHGVLSGSVL